MLSFLAAVAFVAYACATALRARGAPPVAFAALVPAASLLAAVWRATRQRASAPAAGDREREAGSAARAAATGAIVTAFALVATESPSARVLLSAGAGIASAAGLVALARAPGGSGLLRPEPVRVGLAVSLAAAGWAAAAGLQIHRVVIDPARPASPSPLEPYVVAAAALGSLGLALAVAILSHRQRASELGAPERMRAFAWLTGTMIAGAAAAGALGLARVDAALAATAAVAGGLAGGVAHSRAPDALGRFAAKSFALALLAGPIALGAGIAIRQSPAHAVELGITAAALAALSGAAAPRLAARFAPLKEPWAAALLAASESAAHPDPDEAIERALFALRALAGGGRASPILLRLAPPSVITVDRAGYPHVEAAVVPEAFAAVAAEEPEQVLRIEVLRVAAVRRPDAKAALAWMEERDLCASALFSDGDLPIGLLSLPALGRAEPLAYAEVRALRAVADRLGAALSASARLARALEREQELRVRATELAERTAALETELVLEKDRGEALTRALAARVTVAAYSPAARLCLDAIERLASEGRPLTLLTPPGTDALPYAAIYHLASAQRGAGIHIADGAGASFADLALWRSEDESPLARARGGTLVVLDPQRLPAPVQAYIGNALMQGARGLETALVVVVPRTADALVAAGELAERLGDALGDRAVAIPSLAARSEDLRALAIHHLVRIGLRHRGRALGIDPAALAAVVEHDWPGNDVELEAVLTRAALAADGDVVTKADLGRAWLAGRATASGTSPGSRSRSPSPRPG